MRRSFTAVLAAVLAGQAWAVMPELSPLDDQPAYQRARRLIKEQRYAEAIPVLDGLRREVRQSADLYNLLGFAHRKIRDYAAAKDFYDRALVLEPQHLSANEYLGEWFVEMGDLAGARARLSVLHDACGRCEEHDDLAAAIAAAEAKPR